MNRQVRDMASYWRFKATIRQLFRCAYLASIPNRASWSKIENLSYHICVLFDDRTKVAMV